MHPVASFLELFGDADQMAVDRAVAELRSGRPVLVEIATTTLLVLAAEGLDSRQAQALDRLASGRAHLLLPEARLRRLGLERSGAGRVALPLVDAERIERLVGGVDARIDAPVAPTDEGDELALELMRITMMLPAAILVPLDPGDAGIASSCRVKGRAIETYRANATRNLKITGRAPVPLEISAKTEFVVFRGGEGMRDQVAIVVGEPDRDEPVPVRIHSACLTGDLFGSLKCDCGDQLRGAVSWMAENGGGVLLYLDQEGRGNGIANKMRAYRLQADGFDTYDADEVLGFGPDQRRFDFAAAMLAQLGIHRVLLLTNNPEKIAALRTAGLEVVADQRVHGRPTAENVRYLASKRDRAGHLIDFESLFGRTPLADLSS